MKNNKTKQDILLGKGIAENVDTNVLLELIILESIHSLSYIHIISIVNLI